ncbi:MAG: sugar ABC transporter permease [Candidatus Bathyarchaeia archaeon]
MRKEEKVKYLFLLPSVALVLSFVIFPLIYSVFLSLTNWQIGRELSFIGLSNYLKIFTDFRVLNSLEFTLKFIALTVPIEAFLALGLALLSQKSFTGNKVFRILCILPFFASPIALSYLGITIFYEEGGPLNNILSLIGVGKIPWISNPTYAFLSVSLLDIWQWTAFLYVIFLAGLESLPKDIYEAAMVDGASGWRLFKSITLPLLLPIITTGVIFKVIESFKVFDLIYALTGGGPGISTESYTMYIYKTGLRFFRMGYAASLSLILLIILSILLMLAMIRLRRVYEV